MTAIAEQRSVKWWVLLLQGILSIVVGLLFLFKPVATSASAVFVLGLYWLIIGVLDLVSLLRDRENWFWKVLTGILGIVAGGFIVMSYFGNSSTPLVDILGTTVAVGFAFSVVVGILAIVYGVIALIHAFQGGGWGSAILGGLGIVFGLIILFNPALTTLGLPFVVGIWLLISGISLVISAFVKM